MPFVDDAAPEALRILIYSDSGYGKTTLAASLMSLLFRETSKRAFYFDWDGGWKDLVGDKKAYARLWLPGARDPAEEAQEAVEAVLREKSSCFVVDTASVMGREILYSTPAKAGSDVPYDYNGAQLKFDQWVLGTFRLSRAGIHVLVLCHEKVGEVKSARGAVVKVRGGPSVIGNQTIQTLPAAMSLVYRLTVEPSGPTGVRRVLIPDAVDEMFLAKDRLNAFSLRQRVPFGVTSTNQDRDSTLKPVEQFEDECLKVGEKVWRTVLKAAERRASGSAASSTRHVVPSTQVVTGGVTAGPVTTPVTAEGAT